MEEMIRDDKLAKHLLNDSDCTKCKYGISGVCKLVKPAKLRNPDDVQVFINGMLVYDGYQSPINSAVVVEDHLYITQELFGGEAIQIYSRGVDGGEYFCQRFTKSFNTEPYPIENFCRHWAQKI